MTMVWRGSLLKDMAVRGEFTWLNGYAFNRKSEESEGEERRGGCALGAVWLTLR